MNRRKMHFPLLLLACFLYGYFVVPHADAKPVSQPPPIVWPDSPCNLDHRMDVAIVDGMFFECQCMRLLLGYQCDWYLVAGADARPAAHRRIKRHAKRISLIVARPAVVM